MRNTPYSRYFLACVRGLFAISAVGVCRISCAQALPEVQEGLHPYASLHSDHFDRVDLANGNLMLNIPLASFPQQGSLALDFTLVLNSKNWIVRPPVFFERTPQCNPPFKGCNPQKETYPPAWLWKGLGASVTWSGNWSCVASHYEYDDQHPYPIQDTITDPTGAVHSLISMQDSAIQSVPNTFLEETADGSGIRSAPDCSSVIDRSGTIYTTSGSNSDHTPTTQVSTDSNGNTITMNMGAGGSVSGWVDSLGRNIPGGSIVKMVYAASLEGLYLHPAPVTTAFSPGQQISDVSECPAKTASAFLWSIPAYHGTAPYLFCYSSVSLQTAFNEQYKDANGNTLVIPEYSASQPMLTAVVLPPNDIGQRQMWTFVYDSYGNVTKVGIPTGGFVTYKWATRQDTDDSRYLISRTVNANDGAGDHTWSYQYGVGNVGTVVVGPAPDLNSEEHAFSYFGFGVPYETSVKSFQGSGSNRTLLKEIDTHYVDHSDVSSVVTIAVADKITTTLPGSGSSIVTSDSAYLKGDINGSGHTEVQVPISIASSSSYYDYSSTTQPLRTINMTPMWQVSSSFLAANLLDLYGKKTTAGISSQSGSFMPLSETDFVYDESAYGPSGTRGNLTTESRVSPAGSQIVHFGWNGQGQRIYSIDGQANLRSSGHTIDFVYNGCAGKLLSDSYNALNQETSVGYDCDSGLITSSIDVNRNVTAYTYDQRNRIRTVTLPDGGSTSFAYDDVGISLTQTTAMAMSSPAMSHSLIFDGLGRLIHSTSLSDQQGAVTIDTSYDAYGRIAFVSNPHRGSSMDGTSFTYDALARNLLICFPGNGTLPGQCAQGNNISRHQYAGASEFFTDQAGHTWARGVDALGRLVNLQEPSQSVTSYVYDGLDNLTTVYQGNEVRRFTYNALSQLITSESPETGLMCYGEWLNGSCVNGYDFNGNLLKKTDARLSNVSYSYDALNRIVSKRHNGTEVAQYWYDGEVGQWATSSLSGPSPNVIGRLSFVRSFNPDVVPTCDLSSTRRCDDQYFGYDEMGRLKHWVGAPPSEWGSASHSIDATYDLAGNLRTIRYSDGLALTQDYDAVGRLQSVYPTGTSPGEGYVKSVDYHPNGMPKSIIYGNGVNEQLALNNRLQPCESSAFLPSSVGGSMVFDRQYLYAPSSTTPCGNDPNNNGNIYTIANGVNPSQGSGNYNQTFDYDSLNRLKSWNVANMGGQPRAMSFGYDSFGNMTSSGMYSPNARTAPNVTGTPNARPFANALYDPSVWPYDANNRLIDSTFDCAGPGTAAHYDAAGNQLCSGSATDGDAEQYLWDAESRLRQVNAQHNGNTYDFAGLYTYDANGQRIRADYADPGDPNALPNFREYSFFNGQVMAEKSHQNNTENWTDYIYAFGRKIATTPGRDQVLRTSGTASGSWMWPRWDLGRLPVNADGTAYLVKNGDRFCWRQQGTGAGGLLVQLSNALFLENQLTSDGAQIDDAPPSGTAWVSRCFDVSASGQTVGEPFAIIGLMTNHNTPAGPWQISYADMSIVSADGSVTPVDTSAAQTFTYHPAGDNAPDNTAAALAPAATPGATHYFLADQVGTAQLELTAGGWPVWRGEFAPFGQEISNSTATLNRYKFTGKERDIESGLDYFGARYYGSNMGRFKSPDPVVTSRELHNPQSWNKYSYTFNRPLSLTDPDGKWPGWYHTELDRNFFGNQLQMSMHDQQVIVNESASQDSLAGFTSFNGQSTENVRWHGMDDFWRQVGTAQAIANTEAYISQSLNEAVYWQLRADHEGADCSQCHDAALRSLADAEHAGQDLSSPEHQGKPWTMWGAPKHWYDERHSAMSSDASDEMLRAEAIYETQVLYSRYQSQLNAARKKRQGPPSWNCIVNASCQ